VADVAETPARAAIWGRQGPGNQQLFDDFLTMAEALSVPKEVATAHAARIAELRPDAVPDLGALYLRVLAELARGVQ